MPQSDWNQNDSTAKDYVKNRPFYGETTMVTAADSEYTSEPLEDIGGAYVTIVPIDADLLDSLVVEDITFVNITFDGIEYNNLELQWVEELGTFAVGNLSLANPILGTEYSDTEEPFVLAFMGDYDILITDLTQSTTHTVKMDVPQLQIVKQIDDRYLSNDIARIEVVERLFGRINSIATGEIIAGRAYRDANNNSIIDTYLTKANAAEIYVSKEEELNKQLEKNAIIAKFNTSINELATETVRLKNLIGMVKIDWGDGIVNTQLVHSYAQSGSYTCKIYGVTSIGESAFAWSDNLISIEIPDSVTSIDKYAFYECCNLTNVILPKSITNISEGTFHSCTRLTTVEIPNLVGIVGVGAFQNCIRLTDVVLSNSISWILSSAFLNCTSLKNIEIPDSVGWIHNGAFSGCKSLKSVIIPNSVDTVSQDAFYDCENLTIYCEAESKPENWDSDWNSSGCPVVWGYKNKDYPEVVTKLEKIESNYVTKYNDEDDTIVLGPIKLKDGLEDFYYTWLDGSGLYVYDNDGNYINYAAHGIDNGSGTFAFDPDEGGGIIVTRQWLSSGNCEELYVNSMMAHSMGLTNGEYGVEICLNEDLGNDITLFLPDKSGYVALTSSIAALHADIQENFVQKNDMPSLSFATVEDISAIFNKEA